MRKRKSTRNDPDWIHVKPLLTLNRASGGSDRSAKNVITDPTNASEHNTVAIQPATGSPMRLPKSSSTTAPSAGSAGSIQA